MPYRQPNSEISRIHLSKSKLKQNHTARNDDQEMQKKGIKISNNGSCGSWSKNLQQDAAKNNNQNAKQQFKRSKPKCTTNAHAQPISHSTLFLCALFCDVCAFCVRYVCVCCFIVVWRVSFCSRYMQKPRKQGKGTGNLKANRKAKTSTCLPPGRKPNV